MKYVGTLILVLGFLVVSGCPRPVDSVDPQVESEATKAVKTSAPAAKAAIDVAGMKPKSQVGALKDINKWKIHDARVKKYATIAWKLACWVGGAGILLVLPTIFSWFGWTIPVLGAGVSFASKVLGWVASAIGPKSKVAFGSALPRWGCWLIVAAGLSLLASFYMDQLFLALKWTLIGAGIIIGGSFFWELACLYYTGKIDIPGDGIKPKTCVPGCVVAKE